jgi:hypothetical protein
MMTDSEKKPIDGVYELLNEIATNGNAKEKLFGIAIYSALNSLTEESENKGVGIDEYINAISNISIANGSLKEGYIDLDDLSLDNYGFTNLMSMKQDFVENKINSDNEYHYVLQKHIEDDESIELKREWIKNKIDDLNERLQKNEISEVDIEKEINDIVKQANNIFDSKNNDTNIKYVANSDISLRSKIASDLFSLFIYYKPKVDLSLKVDKEDDESKDNYAILTMTKVLFYAHKLGFTRELYQLFYNGREIANNITSAGDAIMKEANEDMYKFFYVDEDEVIKKMENEILNDPKIDQSIKNELDDLFNNNSNLN